MDNMFATFNAHNHYFVIHWNPQDQVFELCDPLANVTTADHYEAMVLLWAMLLASARTEDNLWTVERTHVSSSSYDTHVQGKALVPLPNVRKVFD